MCKPLDDEIRQYKGNPEAAGTQVNKDNRDLCAPE